MLTIRSSTIRVGNRVHSVTTGAHELAQRMYEQALDIAIEPTITPTAEGHCVEFVATDAECAQAIHKAQSPALPQILVAIVAPEEPVRLKFIEPTLAAIEAEIGGPAKQFLVCHFEGIGEDELLGLCNQNGLRDSLPAARFNPATGSWIRGTFLVCGEHFGECAETGPSGRRLLSLTRGQLSHIHSMYGRIENRELFDELSK